jgi:hypothetical protein
MMILAIGLAALALTVAPSLTEETTCPGLKQYFQALQRKSLEHSSEVK